MVFAVLRCPGGGTRLAQALIGCLLLVAVKGSPRAGATTNLGRRGLALVVRKDAASAALLLGLGINRCQPRDILLAIDGPDLVSSGADALVRHHDDMSRSTLLYEQLGLSWSEMSADRRSAALIAATRTASKLLDDQASAVLRNCLTMAAQPVDPYGEPAQITLVRLAAAALLEEHPALDDVVYGRLAQGPPTDLEILATALRNRPRGRPQAVAQLFDK
jgi:hypothetical protein